MDDEKIEKIKSIEEHTMELDSTSKDSDECLKLAAEIQELVKSVIFDENNELCITREILEELANEGIKLDMFSNENTHGKIRLYISYQDKFGVEICDLEPDKVIAK